MTIKDKKYNVKNRSASVAVYRIPELGIRRSWNPGEVKRISFNELEQVTYQPGGRELIANFLQITEEEITDDLGINRQPEYDMSEQQVVELILNGSYDAFLDALDFAPIGVMDLIKKFSVSLPITDMQKRQALKEKTGFDVDKAIENEKADKATEAPKGEEGKVNNTTAATAPGRRVTTSYKVVEKK
jgi:hypothetical protein